MEVLVLGAGRVGSAVAELAGKHHKVKLMDKEAVNHHLWYCDVLHICFPYFEGFEQQVVDYITKTQAALTIIESTVPVGTTWDIFMMMNGEPLLCHSPVRGLHDELLEGLFVYPKHIGGCSREAARLAEDYYLNLGLTTIRETNSFCTELMKLANLSYFGVQIAFFQELERKAKQFGVPMKSLIRFFDNTDDGRTIRNGGFIGGSCVMQGAEKLFGGSELWEWLNGSNEKRKVEG